MTVAMRRNWMLMGAAALLLIVLGLAWADGGREPLREIVQPVALPGAGR